MNVVVTGGGTTAPIDDVRVIANLSTGRFSAAITEACLEHGATVWHLHTPGALLPFRRNAVFDLNADDPEAEIERLLQLRRRYQGRIPRMRFLPILSGTVEGYAEMLQAVLTAQPIDVIFLAMAVSDFQPDPVAGKLDSGEGELLLRCRPTPKVIREVRDWSPESYLVGFKLLSNVTEEHLIAEARTACVQNRADLTVANDQHGVRARKHRIHLVRPDGPVESRGPADDLAEWLVERVFEHARRKFAEREPIPISDDDAD